MWEDAGYPCLKPLQVEDFFLRITTLQSWVYEGPRVSYWLSGLFFPQGFLTSVLQMYARDNSVAISWLYNRSLQVVCRGRGARTRIWVLYSWSVHARREVRCRHRQCREAAPGDLFDRFPVIWLKPVLNEERKVETCFALLYKTSLRAGTLSTTGHSTNFVVALHIPSRNADHWIRRGCAMLCMLDD